MVLSRSSLLFIVLLATRTVTAADLEIDRDTAAARDAIRPAGIAAHMRFLASDLLEGRETGTRGFQIAANYVASQFAAAGLEPAGDQGTFFQGIPFRGAHVVPERSSFTIRRGEHAKTFIPKRDYLLRSGFLRETDAVEASIVFAGFGIVAPELGHDDYASVDVAGKIVLVLTGAPKQFPHNQRAYYSSSELKEQTAAAHGAVGLLTLKSITDEARYPFEKVAGQSGMTPMRYVDARGVPAEAVPQLRARAMVSRGAAVELFAGAPMALDAVLRDAETGSSHSFPLKVAATIRTVTRFSQAKSENVVATLRGSDPVLRDEYVVVSAHLDHLGTHKNGDGDAIFNGAYDNASGIAALIEIARAFASLPHPPARSMIFVALTGEEKGEQGSQYFAASPPVPAASIVADINMDMFLMLFPVKDLVALGGEHSSLGAAAKAAVESVGLELSPDPIPEEVRFIRSDQYSFVKRGTPAVILKTGNTSADPSIDGDKLTKEWLRNVYHTPKDDLGQTMHWETGVRYAKANFVLAWSVANAPLRPQWNAGDFFGSKFGPKPQAMVGGR